MIIVTGGFGFIGSHLVARLLRGGARVHVVDDLSSSPLPGPALKAEWEAAGVPLGRLSSTATTVRRWLARPGDAYLPCAPTMIYHLASVVGPAGVLRHRGTIVQGIVEDTAGLMDLARRAGCRLVDVSTSEVYGGTDGGACREDSSRCVRGGPVVARMEYAVGKLAAETMLAGAAAAGHVDGVIVRPFNVTGPRQSARGGFVLPRFVSQALTGRPLTVFGDGAQVRAFTHVEDVVEGLQLVACRGRRGAAYNLGNPANRGTILQLAARVLAITGSATSFLDSVDPRDVHGPDFAEAPDKWPEPGAAMRELGWRPRLTTDETVADVVRWMRGLSPEALAHVGAA